MDYTPKMADNTMQDRTYLDDAITAREACKLFGIGPDRFLRTRACLPSFPTPVNRKPMPMSLRISSSPTTATTSAQPVVHPRAALSHAARPH